jgi:hypothetical protein
MQARLEEENKQREEQAKPQPGKVQIIPGMLNIEDVEYRLNEVEKIVRWALSHNYSRIDVF